MEILRPALFRVVALEPENEIRQLGNSGLLAAFGFKHELRMARTAQVCQLLQVSKWLQIVAGTHPFAGNRIIAEQKQHVDAAGVSRPLSGRSTLFRREPSWPNNHVNGGTMENQAEVWPVYRRAAFG
jgi:hypothetical protein